MLLSWTQASTPAKASPLTVLEWLLEVDGGVYNECN